MGEIIEAGARLYLMPAGFVDPMYRDSGTTLRLAGGACFFSSLRVIASQYGQRCFDRLIAVKDIGQFKDILPEPLKLSFEGQLANLISKRPLMQLPQQHVLKFERPLIMGILNVTPDSFSDGGQHSQADAAIEYGRSMVAHGAHIVDVGGESTRPGAKPVWEGDEIDRIRPVCEALAADGYVISIDTRKAAVMKTALESGAALINDVSALTYDDQAMAYAAETNCPIVLMHAQGDPSVMQQNPAYDDVLLDIFDWLEERIVKCVDAGIDKQRIIIDPGIGFGKTVRHNLDILNGLALFHSLGCPILFGASRKRFIGALTDEEEAKERIPGSLAVALMALERGVQILRVHDVVETDQIVKIWQGAKDAAQMPPLN